MKVEDLSAIRDGAFIAGVMPNLDAEVAAMDRALETRTLSALERGELTPEAALSAWIEKSAYRKLLNRFRQKIAYGQALGQKSAEKLDKRAYVR